MKKTTKKVRQTTCGDKDAVSAAGKRAREAIQEMLFAAWDAEEIVQSITLVHRFRKKSTFEMLKTTAAKIIELNSKVQSTLSLLECVEKTASVSRQQLKTILDLKKVTSDAEALTSEMETAMTEMIKWILIANHETYMHLGSPKLRYIGDVICSDSTLSNSISEIYARHQHEEFPLFIP